MSPKQDYGSTPHSPIIEVDEDQTPCADCGFPDCKDGLCKSFKRPMNMMQTMSMSHSNKVLSPRTSFDGNKTQQFNHSRNVSSTMSKLFSPKLKQNVGISTFKRVTSRNSLGLP